MTGSQVPQAPVFRAGLGIPAGFALLKVLLHLPVLSRYGYHHDELYFIACGNHLSFGYVDHAPLVPWIARIATTLFGESLYGLRLLPMLAGAMSVFLLGLLVRRVGGGRFAQAVACLAMVIAPVFLRTGNMLCIPAFEPLFWLGASYLLVRLIQGDDPKLWLLIGLVAGAGLMNKHSMLFFGFGLTIALILTPMRKHFRSPWLYAGGAVAGLTLLPNLLWQAANGWPTFIFLLNLNSKVMEDISAGQFVAGQLLYLHPLNLFVWLTGLAFLLLTKAGRPYRVFAFLYVAVFLLLLVIKSKIYYLAPAYPVLLAFGGIAFERGYLRVAEREVQTGRAWLSFLSRPAFVVLWVLGGAAMMPVSVPMLSIQGTDRFMNTVTFGAFGNIYELTGDLHGMFGWPERVDAVKEVYDSLSEEERKTTILLSSSYGKAGAIDYLGKAKGLPSAVSWDQSYWLWGYPKGEIETVIGVGLSERFLEQVFEKTEIAKSVQLENVNPWDTPFLVTINREPKVSMEELWLQVRPW